MKTLLRIALAVSALLSVSCETLDVTDGRGRQDGRDSSPDLQKDGQFYVTVEFPPGYDWLRDTLAGNSHATISLYRNHIPECSFECGPDRRISADPDTHLLLDGKLYTQYSTADSTYIKCNGRNFLQFAGREYIMGVLVRYSDFWTLSQNRTDSGFCLRCNGRVVTRNETGTLFGDIVSCPHPALYEENEQMCYCYKETESSRQFCGVVIEDRENKIDMSSSNILDSMVMDGFVCMACNGHSGLNLYDRLSSFYLPELKGAYVRDCSLFSCQGKLCMAGTCTFPEGWENVDFVVCDRQLRILDGKKLLYVYPCGNGMALLYEDEEETVLELPDESVSVEGKYNAYTRNAVWTDGREWLWALNPSELGGRPCIMTPSGKRELDLYGYVSCVDVIPTQ